MTEEKENIVEENMVKEKNMLQAKKKSSTASLNSTGMWWVVMAVHILILGYVGYVAFWPMAFNDPENTVKKYLTFLKEYQSENPQVEGSTLNLAIEELMKKAEESANDMQQLASQSFNIVLGAFLAFLSATVSTIFQGTGGNKEPGHREPA